jgi:hypothetical protein
MDAAMASEAKDTAADTGGEVTPRNRADGAADNRSAMPGCAAVKDAFEAVFGAVKVRYAAEGGIEKGRASHDVR